MKRLIIGVLVLFLAAGCSSQKATAKSDGPPSQQKKGPPSTDEIFKMDANKDGKLSKAEVQGPLKNDFSKIDSNNDGFITRTELENAPRPGRGQGPPKHN